MAWSKPPVSQQPPGRLGISSCQDVRPSFLLHLRYNFRNPPLGPRDYTAIEHQVSYEVHTVKQADG
jgi:hypothetical protein